MNDGEVDLLELVPEDFVHLCYIKLNAKRGRKTAKLNAYFLTVGMLKAEGQGWEKGEASSQSVCMGLAMTGPGAKCTDPVYAFTGMSVAVLPALHCFVGY